MISKRKQNNKLRKYCRRNLLKVYDKLEDVDLPLVPNVGAAKIERVIKGRHKDKGEGVSK